MEEIIGFVQGVLFETTAGSFIIFLAAIYTLIIFNDFIKNRKYGQLSNHVTIKGRYIYKGAGISIRLKSSNGWKTGVFLGADKNGFLIIRTDENSKIVVDPHFISDIRVFEQQ